jgi:hypothetical protein
LTSASSATAKATPLFRYGFDRLSHRVFPLWLRDFDKLSHRISHRGKTATGENISHFSYIESHKTQRRSMAVAEPVEATNLLGNATAEKQPLLFPLWLRQAQPPPCFSGNFVFDLNWL